MARSRMIKPEFWNDEKLARLTMQARLVYIGIWTQCDDYGYCKGNHAWLKSMILPFEAVPLTDFSAWLAELETEERIIAYEANGECFYRLPNFEKHQKISHKSITRNPLPGKKQEDSGDIPEITGELPENTGDIPVKSKYKSKYNTSEELSLSAQMFDEFYELYPGKKNPSIAPEWVKANCHLNPEIVVAGLRAQIRERELLKRYDLFIPLWKDAANWLKKNCWQDTVKTEDEMKVEQGKLPADMPETMTPEQNYRRGLHQGAINYRIMTDEQKQAWIECIPKTDYDRGIKDAVIESQNKDQ